MRSQTQTFFAIFLFFAVWIGSWAAIAWPLMKKFQWRPFRPTPPEQKLLLLLPLYGLAPGVIWGANSQLNQSWQEHGLVLNGSSFWTLLTGIGVAVGGLILLLLGKKMAALVVFKGPTAPSDVPISWGQKTLTAAGLLAVGLIIGGVEELVFRGWLQTQLELALMPAIAATLGSLIFAAAHLVWDGKAGLWQQPGLFLLGWVLVIARWADGGNLALAWGLHAGWVWALAYIGEFVRPEPVADRPVWLTGRTAQPLTDILDLMLMVATAGLVWQGLRAIA